MTTRKPRDEVALEVKGLNCGALVKNVSFSLRRGEILGFAGLMGAGRTEVARAVFGADRAQSGEIMRDGQEGLRSARPATPSRAGIGYLSEDRKRFGLAVGMDVAANVVMANLAQFLSFRVFLRERAIFDRRRRSS